MTASPNSSSPPRALVRYVEEPRALVAGNRVALLRNGAEAFPAWLAAIDAATARVSLEMYIFSDDAIGRRFAEALSRAAQRGVEVRLLYDFVGCRETPAAFFQRMRGFGVHVVGYHKYRFWRPRLWALLRRNHRKTLVCDGRIAFTGGINISNEWVSKADGGGGWLDAAVAVEGPAVGPMEATFLRTWNRRAPKRMRLDPDRLAPQPPAGGTPLAVISNGERRDRFAIRRAALHAIRESQARVLVANPYFVPDRGVLQALARAARAWRRRAPARPAGQRLAHPGLRDARGFPAAAGGRHPNLPKSGGRAHQGVGGGRFVLLARELQLRPPVACLQPGTGGQRDRSGRRRRRRDDADLRHGGQRGADALPRSRSEAGWSACIERLAYALRRWL